MEGDGKLLSMDGMGLHWGPAVFTFFCFCLTLKKFEKLCTPWTFLGSHLNAFMLNFLMFNLNGYTACDFSYHAYIILFIIKKVHHSFICIFQYHSNLLSVIIYFMTGTNFSLTGILHHFFFSLNFYFLLLPLQNITLTWYFYAWKYFIDYLS